MSNESTKSEHDWYICTNVVHKWYGLIRLDTITILNNGKKHPHIKAITNLKQMPKIQELGKSLLKITMF